MTLYDQLLEKLSGHEYNGYFSCCCVFHNDSSPSMFVYPEGYRCASCGAKGSLQYLARKVGTRGELTRSQSKSVVLPRWRKWEQKYGSLEDIVEHAHRSLIKFPQFQGYLKKRKIPNDYISHSLLGYIDGWLTIPIQDVKGKIVDLVVRAVSGKGETRYVVNPSKNVVRPLFCPNMARLQVSDKIFVPFGIFDAITFDLLDLPAVTGITGQSIPVELLKALGKRFVIVPDAGEEVSAHRLANQLGWRGKVKELKYPDGCKDPDGIRVKFGTEYLQNLLGV